MINPSAREVLEAERRECNKRGRGTPNMIVECNVLLCEGCTHHRGVLHGIELAERSVTEAHTPDWEAGKAAYRADGVARMVDALKETHAFKTSLLARIAVSEALEEIRAEYPEMEIVLAEQERHNVVELASDYSAAHDFAAGDVVRFIDGPISSESEELTVVSFKPAGDQTSYMLQDEANPGADIRSYGTELELVRRR